MSVKTKKFENYFGPRPKKEKIQEILDILEKKKSDVRIEYNSSQKNSYLWIISGQDKQHIYLSPYLVWENLPLEDDKVLQRVRLETEIISPLSKKHISLDQMSKG